MGFPGFPFSDNEKSFIHHTQVLRYLEEYTKHYNLERFIRVMLFPFIFTFHYSICIFSLRQRLTACHPPLKKKVQLLLYGKFVRKT